MTINNNKTFPRYPVKITVVAEVVKSFCQGTYILEGDGPLILTLIGYKVYDYIEKDIAGLFSENVLSKTRKTCNFLIMFHALIAPRVVLFVAHCGDKFLNDQVIVGLYEQFSAATKDAVDGSLATPEPQFW